MTWKLRVQHCEHIVNLVNGPTSSPLTCHVATAQRHSLFLFTNVNSAVFVAIHSRKHR